MDIQERLNLGREALGDNVLPSKGEVIFLYDLIQDLQEENEDLSERVHKLAKDWSEIVDETNRYKQALEQIYKDTFYKTEHELVSPIHVIRKRAEKALEEE